MTRYHAQPELLMNLQHKVLVWFCFNYNRMINDNSFY